MKDSHAFLIVTSALVILCIYTHMLSVTLARCHFQSIVHGHISRREKTVVYRGRKREERESPLCPLVNYHLVDEDIFLQP